MKLGKLQQRCPFRDRLSEPGVTLDVAIQAGLVLLTVVLYGASMSYPFFWDDPVELGRAQTRTAIELLTNSGDYLYYRPLTFIIWKALGALGGGFDPFVLHLVQVVAHAMNGVLVCALVRRLAQHRVVALATACLFVIYPFSYQAVTWIAVAQVPTLTLLLGALVAYHEGRSRHKPGWSWASLFLLTLALFAHESATTFCIIFLMVEVFFLQARDSLSQGGRGLRTLVSGAWPVPALHVLVSLAFTALWIGIPKDASSFALRCQPAVAAYLLQGLIWPVVGAIGPYVRGSLPFRSLVVIATTSILLGGFVLLYRRRQQLSLLGLGVLWFVIPALPIWVTRDFSYVRIAPRLLYVSAPGAALLWGGLVGLPAPQRFPSGALRKGLIWRLGAAVLTAAIVWQSIAFIVDRGRMCAGAMGAIGDIAHGVQASPAEGDTLFINVPDRLSSRRMEYPIGDSLVMVMPIAVEIGDYIALHGGERVATRSLSVPWLADLERYPYEVSVRGVIPEWQDLADAIRAAGAVYLTDYHADGTIRVVEAGAVSTAQDLAPGRVSFGDVMDLLGATLAPSGNLVLEWICSNPGGPQDTVFVHVSPGPGQPPVVQADGDPLRGLWPARICRPGDYLRDVRTLDLESVGEGQHQVLVGIYDRGTGVRLVARDAAGRRLQDDSAVVATWTPEK